MIDAGSRAGEIVLLARDDYPSMDRIRVIGIGNEYARDDAAGLLVVRKLNERVKGKCVLLEHSGDGASLLQSWKGAGSVIVIDALRSAAEPGRVHRFDACLAPLPAESFRGSTHAFGLCEAVELTRSLKQLPPGLVVYGISGQDFTAGEGVSPAVARCIEEVSEAVLRDVEALRRQGDCE